MMYTRKGIRNFGIRTIANFAFAICAVFIFGVTSAQAATITVTSNADSGPGTLEQAILDSNASVGVFDTIVFSGVTSIALTTPLPAITDPVFIDGGANPAVELNGFGTQGAGSASIGLFIRAGNTMVRGMIINRFGEAGIRMDTDGTGIDNGNTLTANIVGANQLVTVALPNINRGILIVGTTGHSIGGGAIADRNFISGNSGNGIEITGGGSATIRNNWIGVDGFGTGDLGNTSHGILIALSSGSVIGGTNFNVTDRNVISGNNGSGVVIIADFGLPASGNSVLGNYIGTTAGGSAALPNNGSGVVVQASGNTIGSAAGGGGRNVIAGNSANGISLSTNFATANNVLGNYIGVGADGTTVIANNNNGIQISNNAASNTIGGTTVTPGMCNNACNRIANNGVVTSQSARAGIYVDPTGGTGNAIRANSIFNNFGLGIDLGTSGATANDAMDPDTGPNNLQNSPVLNSANNAGFIGGRLNSTPNTTFAIDFYRNASPDTAATSEARTFIGSTSVMTDVSGNAFISFGSGATTLANGQFVTATATSTGGAAQAIGDTSEISNAQPVVATSGGAGGFEADVSPRPNGDTFVDADDIQQIRRFSVGLDKPYASSNEAQRADCSPRSQSGDGFVDADDVEQARRYAVGTDPKQLAGGPTPANALEPANGVKTWSLSGVENVPMVGRAVRVVSQTSSAGATVIVPINVDTEGDETGYTFSIKFDQTILTATAVTIGDLGGNVIANINNTNGTIGFSVTSFPGPNGTIAQVTNQTLVRITFQVAANAPAGPTPVSFTDDPARRKVSGTDPNTPLPQPSYTNGTVTILGPTAASVSVGGRLSNQKGRGVANAQITLTNSQGEVRVTRSNSNGYFKFADVAAGESYVITIKSKQYRFASRVVNVVQDLDDVNFTAQPRE